MIEELTDDQLAEYHLAWVHDYGGPSLRYAGMYDIIGVPFDDIECLLEPHAMPTLRSAGHSLAMMAGSRVARFGQSLISGRLSFGRTGNIDQPRDIVAAAAAVVVVACVSTGPPPAGRSCVVVTRHLARSA